MACGPNSICNHRQLQQTEMMWYKKLTLQTWKLLVLPVSGTVMFLLLTFPANPIVVFFFWSMTIFFFQSDRRIRMVGLGLQPSQPQGYPPLVRTGIGRRVENLGLTVGESDRAYTRQTINLKTFLYNSAFILQHFCTVFIVYGVRRPCCAFRAPTSP